jgi:hypothetical protein
MQALQAAQSGRSPPPSVLIRSRAGLSTPFQLTNTKAGEVCHELDQNQSAFVQAAILDPRSGQISIYAPLVARQRDADDRRGRRGGRRDGGSVERAPADQIRCNPCKRQSS